MTIPFPRVFWELVEELRKSPEKFVEEKFLESQEEDSHSSDTASWATEFEDDDNEDSVEPEIPTGYSTSNHESNKTYLQEAAETPKDGSTDTRQDEEGTYANCGPLQNDENNYKNFQDRRISATKNISKLHNQVEKSLIDQLRDQLELMNIKKPVTSPKPESLKAKTAKVKQLGHSQPRKSFLYNAPTIPSQLRSFLFNIDKCENQ